MIKNIISGGIIGSSMMLPGVSGGTMAIIIGIYDKLINAVADINKEFKKNIVFLLQICIGGLAGVLLLSKLLLKITELFHTPMMFLFIGIILGSVPLLVKKSGARFNSIIEPIYILIGFLIILLISKIPTGYSEIMTEKSLIDYIKLFIIGFIISIALVLPGISATYTLLVFGMYESFLNAISGMDIGFLLPLALGLVVGIFTVTRLLKLLMERFSKGTFLIICGFMIGSVIEIFPGFPGGVEITVCIFAFVLGFLLTFFMGKSRNTDLA